MPPQAAGSAQSDTSVLGALVRHLNPEWSVVRSVRLSINYEHCHVELVLLHPRHGIALVALDRGEWVLPELGTRLLRAVLEETGFSRHYPGHLPVVFVSVDRGADHSIANEVTQALIAERSVGIADPTWVRWATHALTGKVEPATPETGFKASPEPSVTDIIASASRFPVMLTITGVSALALTAVAAIGLLALPTLQTGFVPSALARVAVAPEAATERVATPAEPTIRHAMTRGRLLNSASAAAYLGLDSTAFRVKYAELRTLGFPPPEPVTGNFDQTEIDRWIDARRAQIVATD